MPPNTSASAAPQQGGEQQEQIGVSMHGEIQPEEGMARVAADLLRLLSQVNDANSENCCASGRFRLQRMVAPAGS